MKTIAKILGSVALSVTWAATQAQVMTVVSFGGSYGAAQEKHMITPFAEKTGVKILFEDYSGGVAELKAQVDSGNVQWDVVDIEAIDLERACAEGLLEEIPRDILPPGVDGTPASEDFIPAALESECGVGVMVWTMIYAYNNDTIGPNKPSGIADLFDTTKFPGKRALRKRPQASLEWALLADGVSPDKVYEVLATQAGQDQAFAKLDTIKSDIVWFDSWSQAPQLLNDGGATFVQAPNGRIFAAINEENRPFTMVWDSNLYDQDVWSIVKGSKNKKLGLEFLAYATGSVPVAGMSDVAYGPPRKSALAYIDPSVIAHLPTSHMDKGIKVDSVFWADYGETLGEKFNEWLLK